jgi:hypothetical protein
LYDSRVGNNICLQILDLWCYCKNQFFIYLGLHITCEVYTDLKTNLISSLEPINGEKSVVDVFVTGIIEGL